MIIIWNVFGCLVAKSCQTLETPWIVAHQTPLSMAFSRQKYCSGLPFPSPGDLPNPGFEPTSPALAGRFFTTEPPGKPTTTCVTAWFYPYQAYRWFCTICRHPPKRGQLQHHSGSTPLSSAFSRTVVAVHLPSGQHSGQGTCLFILGKKWPEA